MSTQPKINKQELLADFRKSFSGKVRETVIAGVKKHLSADLTPYAANGSIYSMFLYVGGQCTVTSDGKVFKGSAWGISIPGGGALFGTVYTSDLRALYANTISWVFNANLVYTAFYFLDVHDNVLGSFQAGSLSTVSGEGGGDGGWS